MSTAEISSSPAADVQPPTPRTDWFSGTRLRVVTVVQVAAFFAVWELVARSGAISSLFLPRPSAMAAELWRLAGEGGLWSHLRFSLTNFALGVGAGTVVGVVVGLLAGINPFVRRVMNPYLWVMASLPRIAWLPLLLLIFGYSNMSKLTLIFMSAVFPIIINTLAGVRTIDRQLLNAGRIFGARRYEIETLITLPHTLPFIVVGFKQGVTRALAAVVVSEMFGGSQGIGYLIVLAGQRFQTALLFGLLLFFVVLALVVVRVVDVAERRFVGWRSGEYTT